MAAAGFGVLVVACNATPDIPNDLRSNAGTYPSRNARNGDDADEAAPEGEQELTGGRGPGSSPPATPDGGASTPEPDAGTTPTPDAGTTPPPTNNQCANTATQGACFQCCEQQNPGTSTKWNQYWDDCACAANRCGAQCAQTWCAGFLPNQGDACDACLDNASNACSTQADAVCKQDATCAQLVLCDEGSGCLAKPQ
jgi:hypothetical protein